MAYFKGLSDARLAPFAEWQPDECPSPELSKRIDEYMVLLPGARAITPARHDRMPYRVFFAQIGERLRHTYEGRANGYQNLRQFRADVPSRSDELAGQQGANAGLFYVQRLLRRIDTFGFHLATLDVRQHASVLHDVVSRGLDDPDWLLRSSKDRRRLLADALEKDLGPSVELDALGKRNLAVFDAIMQGRHRYGPAAVGYFIVNGATGADDVLAALLLARWAEAYDKHTGEVALDIAPQFGIACRSRPVWRDDAGNCWRSVVSATSRSAWAYAVRADWVLGRQ